MSIVGYRNGHMVLKQVKVLYPEQANVYSAEWQAGEANADTDNTKGDVQSSFGCGAGSLAALKHAKI